MRPSSALCSLLASSLCLACAGRGRATTGSPAGPTGLTPPAAFGKTSPPNTGVNRSLSATLSWQGSSGAASYEYCVDATLNGACDSTWMSVVAPTASITLPNSSQAYEWQVRARNAQGTTEANGGSWWTFTIALADAGAAALASRESLGPS